MGKFGEYLKLLREQKGLSLREVENLTEISNSYLSQVESGVRGIPKPPFLAKLAEAYGVRPEVLYQEAGYLEKPEEGISDQDIDWAYRAALSDPKFRTGHRVSGKLSREAKLFIIELYEKATGKRLLKDKGKKS